MEGCGGNGAGLLGPRGQRGEPQAQPERQPGQVCGVVEKVKFQAGVHQAFGAPVAADAGEWPREPLGVSPSLFPSARESSPFHGAELASIGAPARELVEPVLMQESGSCEEGGRRNDFLFFSHGESSDVSGVSAKKKNMF